MKTRDVLAIAAVGVLCASLAQADQITIRAAKDTTLYEVDSSYGNGAGDYLFTGRTNKRKLHRALIAFDVASSLPSGTKLTSATLQLFLSRGQAQASEVSIFPVTSSWGEGTANAPANEGSGVLAANGDATWSHRLWATEAWSVVGGDFSNKASATTTVDVVGNAYQWTGDAVLGDAQRWLDDPANNFGWIVIAEKRGRDTSKRFNSRTGPRGTGPGLVIEYDTPSKPSGACCAADGTCTIRLDPGKDCSGTYQGKGTVCTLDLCPPPSGACCHRDVAAECTPETESACNVLGGAWQGPGAACDTAMCPVVLTPYVDPLPMIPVATPVSRDGGAGARYEMAIRQSEVQLHRDLPKTTVWGYDDGATGAGMLGPTIEAHSGEPVEVKWSNDLRDSAGNFLAKHPLSVDQCLHGASTDAPRAVVHLHGGHVPSKYDGQPELTLLPGEDTTYVYPNNQPASTLWYHDHALGITRLNVMMGLAGFYILRDDDEAALPLPSGKYEIPLVIQDRSFSPDGQFRYPDTWQEHFFGDTALVNGKVWPFLNVDRGLYRFRVLNGSTSRTYTLALSTAEPFRQIGTEGGLLDHPVALNQLTIAPGERADLVVDFSTHQEGDEIVLTNSAPAPFPAGEDMHALPNVMQFVVGKTAGYAAEIPGHLRFIARLSESSAAQTRDFVLARMSDSCAGAMWMINGKHWDDIEERPKLGTTEIWRFVNHSGLMHPMHMHLVMFQVLDRQAITLGTETADGGATTDVLAGDPIPAIGAERGWKDTVEVMPFQIVRVIAKFTDYAGRFAYHCHILEHEDNEMMRQYETVSVCGDGVVTDDEECDDGNTKAGDGCAVDCKREPPKARPKHASPAPWKGDGCACRLSLGKAPGTRGNVAWLSTLALIGVRRRCRRGRAPLSCS